MSFWEHLDVLRGSLFRALGAVCLCSVLGLVFREFLFDGIVLAPTRSDFIVYRLLGWSFSMELINVEISAQFFVHLKASFAVGLIVAFPYVVWELWRFLAPALYEKEKKAVRAAFGMATGLFYLGVLVGYFIVLPVCLQFFMNYTVSDAVANTITIGSYMSMFFSMVLLIGVVFEFPTVVLALNRLGVLDRGVLRKGRRYAVIVVLVLAALITPSDPFSMFVLAIPLYFLYEFSILLCSKSAESPETNE
ncbi:MAG: twin-arginine translocase subunit TatC [Bacteroidales bacterium]|nr:twin-arginine translocase subunit TatC [Bacteroidales bacterium]MDY6444889.1 twin-arginine translocase subunit TatC [Bacteroidales bacterium]